MSVQVVFAPTGRVVRHAAAKPAVSALAMPPVPVPKSWKIASTAPSARPGSVKTTAGAGVDIGCIANFSASAAAAGLAPILFATEWLART